jgi:poly-gamma-glutamate capsule biosynthesis protein CapA/YwtB (metallophosphatase superfamily)
MSSTIGLLGDVMLGRAVADRLAQGRPEGVWSAELAELCAACDALICNLECCISSRGRRTERLRGKRFFFRAPPVAVQALTAVGATAVSLANNHALDYETHALADTLTHLAAAGIESAGAGADAQQARRGTVVTAGELRLGIVAITDHPRAYAAGDGQAGVAWGDLRAGVPDWLVAELTRLRRVADLVIVFPHWGPNMTSEPADWQRERARELLAVGADLLAGHSAHVFHGIELIEGRPALYDLGDALDDYAVDPALRNDLGVLVRWRPTGEPELELIGLRLDFCEISLATGADADWIATRLTGACAKLGTPVARVSEERLIVGV